MSSQESKTEEPEKKKRKLIVTEIEPSGPVKFDGNHFRKLIKGEHPLGALKQLLAVAKNSTTDIIGDYLKAGGSALEVILVIDKLEQKIHYHYQPIFSVLTLILNKVRDEIPRLGPTTEEACRRLLRHYNQAIHSLLATNSTHTQKKIALVMLTAMVTMSDQLAREVLSSLSLREITMNDLAKHPVKYDPDCTRAHFIRYVLAFFYHESTLLIKQLLEQRHLLQCIILAGLTLDDAQLLMVFLTTLKEKIVDNPAITKTTKLKMFNTKIMIKLLEAYTWTGPVQSKHNSVDNDLVNGVSGSVHQLLIQLCTNHKLGVAFIDPTVGLDAKNYNDLVFSVIKSMDPYWYVSWVRELALKIVTACPDLVAASFRHFGLQGYFQVEVTYSFVHTCEFAKQVLDSLTAERCLVKNSTPDQLTHLTIRSVLNMNVVGCVRESLQSIHPTLRLQAVSLLNSMFQALDRFMSSVKSWFSSNPKNFIEYQQKLNDHISKNLGVEEELMVAWSLGVSGDQSLLKVPTETEYFLPLIDLLLSYTKVFPVYLPPVFVSKLQATCLDTIDTQTKQLFDVKVIKFIIMFKNIQPTQPEFQDMLKTLVPLLADHSEAKSVIKSLLLQTGFFEGVEIEVDVWVRNLALFPGCDCHLPLLLASLQQVVSKSKKCMKMIAEATVKSAANTKTEFNWAELIEVAKNPLKSLTPCQRMLPSTRLSILVPALIRMLNTTSLCSCKFTVHLLGNILFNQVDHAALLHLIQQCTSPLVDPIKEYIANFNSGERYGGVSSKQPFNKHTHEYRMLKALTSKHFSEDNPLKGIDDIESENKLLMVRLIVFYITRSNDEDLTNRGSRILEALVSRLVDDNLLLNSALQEVLLHPQMLHRFDPLSPSSSPNTASIILSLVQHIDSQQENLLRPYRQRFLVHIQKAIKKNKKVKNSSALGTCSKLISGDEVVSILTSIVEFHSELEEWTDVANSLLQSATSLKCLLPGEVVEALSKQDTLHNTLVKYLSVFPHLIYFINRDYLAEKREELSELCLLALKFDLEGVLLKKLIKNNKKNPKVWFPALAAATCRLQDTSLVRQASRLVGYITEALGSDTMPAWLSENSECIGKLICDLSEEECEEVYSSLSCFKPWSETHLDIASYVYPRTGHVVDFVAKTLELLVTVTTPTTMDRSESVCAKLRTVLRTAKISSDRSKGLNWKSIKTCEDWLKWVRLALKLGETPDSNHSFLLITLSELCEFVYSEDNEGVKLITEMVTSHSQFLSVMLAKPSPTKTALLELLYIVLGLDPSVMASTHIPIFLAVYSASLSAADQVILQLLQLYESNGIVVTDWKPFFWGEAAASFYSVRSTIAPGLWNKQNFTQLMDLFDENKVNSTIAGFPIQRGLKPKDKMDDKPDVYDPAFYLPMLVAMFAPSEIFYTYKTCQSGCLSLILMALASYQEDVRTVGYVALQRFHAHLIKNTNNQDTLWLHFLDSLRRGLSGHNETIPRLSCIVAVFLARAVMVLTSPSHPLYLPLSQFVLAKPRFDLDTTPEFLPLFNSFSVEHHSAHQEWILTVLKDGLRDDVDFNICLNSMVFKVILDFFSSTLASDKVKVLILDVLGSAVKMKYGRNLLSNGYSLLPWLTSVVREPNLPPVLISPLIHVLASVLHKSSAAQVVPLLMHVTRQYQLAEPQLTEVLAALVSHPLPRQTVSELVDVVDSTVGEVFQHRTMLQNGVTYVTKDSAGSKDARGHLKQIIFRLYQSEM